MSLVRPITRRDTKGPALHRPTRDDDRRRVIAVEEDPHGARRSRPTMRECSQ
jgi:hypothetical protein